LVCDGERDSGDGESVSGWASAARLLECAAGLSGCVDQGEAASWDCREKAIRIFWRAGSLARSTT